MKIQDYSNESVVEYFEKYLKNHFKRNGFSHRTVVIRIKRMSFIEMTPLLFCVEKIALIGVLSHLTIEADVLIGMY